MVILTGARQAGKTTLSRKTYPDLPYINLDAPEAREALRSMPAAGWAENVGSAFLDQAKLTYCAPGPLNALTKIRIAGRKTR
ncbi:MAG: AAA family ATPase [Thermodesulfobacteriota bacterium]